MERTITITESQALLIKQSLNRTRAVLYKTASEHKAEAMQMFKEELENIFMLEEMLLDDSPFF